MKLNKQGKQAYKLVESLFYARRNSNIAAEQKAYNNLREWCEKHNADMEQVIQSIRLHMKENSVSAGMNGLV